MKSAGWEAAGDQADGRASDVLLWGDPSDAGSPGRRRSRARGWGEGREMDLESSIEH